MSTMVRLTHNKVALALHHLRPGHHGVDHRPLLVLHGLGERTPDAAPSWLDAWPGPLWGLDLTGHGESSSAPGGGYTAEVLMADAVTALDHLGPVTILGRGLGAYVALLTAGARPDAVRGAILADGPGLAGGGPFPSSPMMVTGIALPAGPPDPFAIIELSRDIRPPDYAIRYVDHLAEDSDLDEPLTVTARVRPPWLAAVVDAPGVVTGTLSDALTRYRSS